MSKKMVSILGLVLCGLVALADVKKGREIWSLSQGVDAPECAYFDPESGFLFVSNQGGAGDKKDGKGWIDKLTAEGKVVASQWVKDLNAPKGMRSFGGTLWVSDITDVVSIEIATGKVKARISVAGSKFLNDVAIGPNGTVYVSDTLGDKIFSVSGSQSKIFLEGRQTQAPNGLLVEGTHLVVAAWGNGLKADWSTTTPGHLYKVDLATKKISLITPKPLGNLDGLEIDPAGGYFVSDWMAGKLYRVKPDGSSREILSSAKGAADIGFNPKTYHVVIPGSIENRVTAYDAKI